LQQRPTTATTGNDDIAAKTGNTYIPETTTDSVEIPATNNNKFCIFDHDELDKSVGK